MSPGSYNVFAPKIYSANTALASLVDLRGSVMPAKCLSCDRRGIPCIKSADSSRCSECIRRKVTCRFEGPNAAEMVRVHREALQLREELRIAEVAEEEMRARVLRLRQQNRVLDAKISEMIRRGCESLDELDAVEAEEARAAEAAKQSEAVAVEGEPRAPAVPESDPVLGDFDWSTVDLSGVNVDAFPGDGMVPGSGSGSGA
ncbi:hypothetical protein VM1G_11044 [Cytospora mali]|nr:hypothetical protein VM1G_11044 [Valsa mali]